MSYYSEMTAWPKISEDKVQKFKEKVIEINSLISEHGLNWKSKKYDENILTFVYCLDCINSDGSIEISNTNAKWGNCEKLSEFFLPYITDYDVEELLFKGENGETWGYVYRCGNVFNVSSVNDVESALFSMLYEENLPLFTTLKEAFATGIDVGLRLTSGYFQ